MNRISTRLVLLPEGNFLNYLGYFSYVSSPLEPKIERYFDYSKMHKFMSEIGCTTVVPSHVIAAQKGLGGKPLLVSHRQAQSSVYCS